MFMESWILQVSCKVSEARSIHDSISGFTYLARDPKYSWFHFELHLLCKRLEVFMIPFRASLTLQETQSIHDFISGFTYFARDPKYSWFHFGLHLLCKRPEVFMIPWTFQKLNLFLKTVQSLTPCLLLSSDNLCKQLGSRSGLTFCQAWSGAKLFDILIWYSWWIFL